METAAELRKRLLAFPEGIREAAIRQTAYARHRSRVLATVIAAVKAAATWCAFDGGENAAVKSIEQEALQIEGEGRGSIEAHWGQRIAAAPGTIAELNDGEESWLETARVILTLDIEGVGGGADGEGHRATDRLLTTLGYQLGKGRWLASDGAAYLAAAREALSILGGPASLAELVDFARYGRNEQTALWIAADLLRREHSAAKRVLAGELFPGDEECRLLALYRQGEGVLAEVRAA